MIERLGALLADLCSAEQPPTPREVAELIWLAAHLPEESGRSRPTVVPSGKGSTPSALRDGPEQEPLEAGHGDRSDSESTRLYVPRHPSLAEEEEPQIEWASPVRVAGPPALPGRRELARALRPLKRRVPSRIRTVLDENATVSRIADHDHWVPVLAPAADRWLDVRIVLDSYGEGAVLWEPLARELCTLLLQLGAFRDVRLHHLAPSGAGCPGIGTGTGSPTSPQPLRSTRSLVDPTGRTVILVLTDGVAPAWHTGPMLGALRTWADHGPTAVLQTLPESVWARTALVTEPGRFRTTEAGSPTSRLLFTGYGLRPPVGGHHIRVPVLGVTPEWLGPWAHAIAQPAAFDGAALLLPSMPRSSDHRVYAPSGLDAPDRSILLEDFQAQAQPDVLRLAAYLAAAPLNLGVMRTVQSAMLPSSPMSDLAEIVYSGLLRKVGGGVHPDDALNQAYEFLPGVRERLLSTIRRDEADEIIATVSAYVDRNVPASGARFTAAVRDPDGTLALPTGAGHWAEVHNLVRRRQGRRGALATPHVRPPVDDLAPKPSTQSTARNPAPPGPATVGRRFLVTIGVSRHEDPSLPDLPGVRRDIVRMHDLFEGLGYTHVLLELAEDPQRAELVQGLRSWSAEASLGSADVVVVYFAGTAERAGGRLRLLASDSRSEDARTTLIAEEALSGVLLSDVGHLLLLLDTCAGHPDVGDGPSWQLVSSSRPGSELSVLSVSMSYESEEGSQFTEALTHAVSVLGTVGGGRFIDLAQVRQRMSEYLSARLGGSDGEVTLTTSDAAEQPFFPNPEHYDVFISYAHEDGQWTITLAEDLRRRGLRVWLDRWELSAGQDVTTGLRDGLAKADAMVAVVSPGWLASEWARREFEAATADGRTRVIPVLRGEMTRIPTFIGERKYLDFRRGMTPDEYEQGLRQLVHTILPRPASAPTAASPAVSSWLTEPRHDSGIRQGRRDSFLLFGHPTDCHIYEGDGTRAIEEENVRIRYTPVRVTLPEEIAGWRRAIEGEERRKQAEGLAHRWNSRRFAVEALTTTRSDIGESPIVTLSLLDADYFDFLATALNLDRPQENGLTLRRQYLESQDPVGAPSFLSCGFGVHVAVRTGVDGRMLFSRRSRWVAGPNGSCWNSSANVGMGVRDDLGPDGQLSLHAVARRALRDQLAIGATDSLDLELLGFGLDLQNNQWAAFFSTEVHDLDEGALRRRWARGVENKWVHDEHAFVPADPESVFSFLLSKPADQWTPCAAAVYYLALVRAAVRSRGGDPVGRFDVDDAEQRVLRAAAGTDG
ncbi:SAV_2336 N-terminal domain-related protein [Streptomyces sp. NPDC057494]|uniref:SAV_2336 N-terminal domain-related protein n=1 Tax=Streptomyces sp. NPDC057494 TaxID=3346148 RepID=UPI0036C52F83